MKCVCGVLAAVSALLFTACDEGERPVLGELVVDSVGSDAVYCHVAVMEGTPVDYAFCYATTKSGVEKSDAASVRGEYGDAALSAVVSDLKPNTTYYIRAYAMNFYGRTYTETVSVRTLPRVPTMDDNDYPTID